VFQICNITFLPPHIATAVMLRIAQPRKHGSF